MVKIAVLQRSHFTKWTSGSERTETYGFDVTSRSASIYYRV